MGLWSGWGQLRWGRERGKGRERGREKEREGKRGGERGRGRGKGKGKGRGQSELARGPGHRQLQMQHHCLMQWPVLLLAPLQAHMQGRRVSITSASSCGMQARFA